MGVIIPISSNILNNLPLTINDTKINGGTYTRLLSVNEDRTLGEFDITTALGTKQDVLSNPIIGTGVTNSIAFFNDLNNIASTNVYWNKLTNSIGINTNSPLGALHVNGPGSTPATWTAQFHNSTGTSNTLMIRDDGFIFHDGGGTNVRINASSAGYRSLAIGTPDQLAIAGGSLSTAVGPSAQTATTYATAYGWSAYADENSNIVINAVSNAPNIVTFGPRQLYATPFDTFIRAVSGSGTNINGASIYIQGGRPTGNGLSGDVIFSTATTGASGKTLRNLTDRWAIKGDTGHLQALGAFDIVLDTTTGSKIGGAGAKLAFYDNTPIAQPTTAVASASYVNNGGTGITDTDTFDGYTLSQVVKALRDIGALT